MDNREIIAQALFEAQWRVRRWGSATDYTKNIFRKRADEALKRAEQSEVRVQALKESK